MTYEEYPGNLWQLDLQPRPTPLESSMLAINSSSDSIFSRPAKNHRKLRQVTYSSIKRRQRMPLFCILHIDMCRQCTETMCFWTVSLFRAFLVVLLALFFAQRQNVGCLDLFGSHHRKVKISAITSISSPFCIFGICFFASFQSLTAKL